MPVKNALPPPQSLRKILVLPPSVHGKKKFAAGHMDRLLRKAAGPQQKLPVHTQD